MQQPAIPLPRFLNWSQFSPPCSMTFISYLSWIIFITLDDSVELVSQILDSITNIVSYSECLIPKRNAIYVFLELIYLKTSIIKHCKKNKIMPFESSVFHVFFVSRPRATTMSRLHDTIWLNNINIVKVIKIE